MYDIFLNFQFLSLKQGKDIIWYEVRMKYKEEVEAIALDRRSVGNWSGLRCKLSRAGSIKSLVFLARGRGAWGEVGEGKGKDSPPFLCPQRPRFRC